MNNKSINIFTDGSCQNNGEPNATCGWGLIASKGSIITHESYGRIRKGRQTVFRAELESFLQALLYARECDEGFSFVIYSDSLMLVEASNGLCSRKSNKDIWEQVEEISQDLLGRVKVKHIKSHTNKDDFYSLMNSKVDKLAKQGALHLFEVPIEVTI